MVPLWTPNKGSGHQFVETVYISEVNWDMKVKPNAQLAMNKNSPRAEIYFLGGWLVRAVFLTEFFPNFWNCPKRVEL